VLLLDANIGMAAFSGVEALVTGIISVYSSTSGGVLPAFLPTVPGLIARPGGNPFAVATSMNVGAHLVDMSPLSTTGAICIAGIANEREVRPTYKLLAWGVDDRGRGAGMLSVLLTAQG
jgi:hypothetical protein